MEVNWSPGIGDPTVTGWLTVAAYFFAAVFSFRAANVAQLSGRHWQTESMFWLCVTLSMIALGLNKQLDLQSLLTEVARLWAKDAGWYERRRIVQERAIGLMVFAAIATAAGLCILLRRTAVEVKLGAVGLCFVFAFVLIRAASFHHVDALIGRGFGGITWNALLELLGILMVGLSAASYAVKQDGRRSRNRMRRPT